MIKELKITYKEINALKEAKTLGKVYNILSSLLDEITFDECMYCAGEWVKQNIKFKTNSYNIKKLNYVSDDYDYFLIESKNSKTHWICRNEKGRQI